MQRQNQRAGFADAQARTHLHACGLQPGDFLDQLGGREHHAIADVAHGFGPHHAAGNQVQGGFLAVDDQSVPRIVPAMKAHYGVSRFAQPIHQFAFAFITPLGAYDNDVAALDGRGLGSVHVAHILCKTEKCS